MTSDSGMVTALRNFTVRDEAIAARLNSLLGKRVVLRHEEHRGIPTTCCGDTRHFVTRVQVIE